MCHFQKVLCDRTSPDPPGTPTLTVCFSSTFACELHIHSSFTAQPPPPTPGETRSGGLRLALRRRESKHPECPQSAGGGVVVGAGGGAHSWDGGGSRDGLESSLELAPVGHPGRILLHLYDAAPPPPPPRRADGWGSYPSQRLQMAFNSEKFICCRD